MRGERRAQPRAPVAAIVEQKHGVVLLCSAYAGRAVAARRAAAARLPEKMGGRQASVCSAAQCTHGRFCVASSHMMMASEYTSQACGRAAVTGGDGRHHRGMTVTGMLEHQCRGVTHRVPAELVLLSCGRLRMVCTGTQGKVRERRASLAIPLWNISGACDGTARHGTGTT